MSILPVISKTFEKLLCKQITFFIDPLLSNFQGGFLAMLEHWKSEIDKRQLFGGTSYGPLESL